MNIAKELHTSKVLVGSFMTPNNAIHILTGMLDCGNKRIHHPFTLVGLTKFKFPPRLAVGCGEEKQQI
jgi:hypothetical protein